MELLDWFRAKLDPQYARDVEARNNAEFKARAAAYAARMRSRPPAYTRVVDRPDSTFTDAASAQQKTLAGLRYISRVYGRGGEGGNGGNGGVGFGGEGGSGGNSGGSSGGDGGSGGNFGGDGSNGG